VKHAIYVVEFSGEKLSFADIYVANLRVGIAASTSAEVVQHPHSKSRPEQSVDQMRSDKARPTCNYHPLPGGRELRHRLSFHHEDSADEATATKRSRRTNERPPFRRFSLLIK